MATKTPAVYWDSCVFIDWMRRNKPERLPLIEPVVKAAVDGQIIIATSTVTLVEVARTEDGVVVSSKQEKAFVEFFKNDYIEVRTLDRGVAEIARHLQREASMRGMKMPKMDAIHLATAISLKVDTLHTFDEKDLVPHSGLWGDPLVKICLPRIAAPSPEQFSIFDPPQA